MDPDDGTASAWKRGLGVIALLGVVLLYFSERTACLPGPVESTHAYGEQRIKVRFWHMWTAEWKTVVERIVERFNRSQSQYEAVALSVPPAGAESKLLLAAVGGDPPDVMAEWQNVIPTWAKAGMLTPLDALMSESDRATFQR